MSINFPNADFTPQLAGYTGQGAFRFWCQKVLPIVYDDSLSYYELLNKVVNYLNNVIADVASVEGNIRKLNDSYVDLQDYVNDHMQELVSVVNVFTNFVETYFDNLDVQEEINNKLNQMASDGSLTALVKPIVDSTAPDVITAWLAENITPTTPVVDRSLSISGAAADALVTGSRFGRVEASLGGADSGNLIGTYENGYCWESMQSPAVKAEASSDYNCFAPIEVVPGNTYHVYIRSGGSSRQYPLLFVDENYNILYHTNRLTIQYIDETGTVPAGAKYALLTSYGVSSDFLYEEIGLIDVDVLETEFNSVKAGLWGVDSGNLIGGYENGYYWRSRESPVAKTEGSSDYNCFAPIEVVPGNTYHVYIRSGGSSNQYPLLFVDENYNILYHTKRLTAEYIDETGVVPEGAKYALLTSYGIRSDFLYEETGLFNIEFLDKWQNEIEESILTLDSSEQVTMIWQLYGDAARPTGFRPGYVSSNGATIASQNYLRSLLIPANRLSQFKVIKITPPDGYFVWASVFENDYTGVDNFKRQYGDYENRVTGPITILLNDGESIVVNLGRFNGDAADYNNDTFLAGIIATAYYKDSTGRSKFYGKKLSVMGDSISAYSGVIPAGNRSYYPAAGVSDPNEMWYAKLAEKLALSIDVVNGWSGSCVTYGVRNDETYLPSSSDARTSALGNPDIILIAMGVNDYSYMASLAKFGTWDGSTSLGENLGTYDTSTFRTAYASMLAKIRANYPDADIFCITPWFTCRHTIDTGVTYLNKINKQECEYSEAVEEVAQLMNCQILNGTNIGINRSNFYPTYAQDSSLIPTHPNPAGHEVMALAIAEQLMTKYNK